MGRGGSHLPLEALEIPGSCFPLFCLAPSQPGEGVRGIKWRKKEGQGTDHRGANPSVLALTPPGHSSPCERFQACSPLRKPSMPKSTHTKQTHQGGPCTIKGFFALQEGSAHGKLKIGASPGVVKEALISEAPYTPHASDTFRKLATPTGLAGPWLPPGADISGGTSTVVLIVRVPLWGCQGEGVSRSRGQAACCASQQGCFRTPRKDWKATPQHSWQGFHGSPERTDIQGFPVPL